ncbi:hypothetical protein IWQ56_003464, partial [Coemansia nantahalensis]
MDSRGSPRASATSGFQADPAKHAQIETVEDPEAEQRLIKSYLRKSDLRLLP